MSSKPNLKNWVILNYSAAELSFQPQGRAMLTFFNYCKEEEHLTMAASGVIKVFTRRKVMGSVYLEFIMILHQHLFVAT